MILNVSVEVNVISCCWKPLAMVEYINRLTVQYYFNLYIFIYFHHPHTHTHTYRAASAVLFASSRHSDWREAMLLWPAWVKQAGSGFVYAGTRQWIRTWGKTKNMNKEHEAVLSTKNAEDKTDGEMSRAQGHTYQKESKRHGHVAKIEKQAATDCNWLQLKPSHAHTPVSLWSLFLQLLQVYLERSPPSASLQAIAIWPASRSKSFASQDSSAFASRTI